jgi:putative ABC transport system substrate-binding protein
MLEVKLPSMYQYRPFCAAGGLLSYGASNVESHRRMGIYVGRGLRGARPGDLPVEQSEKLELFVNGRTAKELGLQLPAAVLARADEVLE